MKFQNVYIANDDISRTGMNDIVHIYPRQIYGIKTKNIIIIY